MWKITVLTVFLLLAGAEALGGPSYGVKLCGREFIRAVIFTCGGSRWKRSLTNTDEVLDLLSSDRRNAAGNWMLHPSFSQLSSELDPLTLSAAEQEGPARSLVSETPAALPTTDRKQRDVVAGISNACCKWGCSKSEISSLC